jgi:hypothetical protein
MPLNPAMLPMRVRRSDRHGDVGVDVRREFVQRLYVDLHGTVGSYLRDAWQEGGADTVACLPTPRA